MSGLAHTLTAELQRRQAGNPRYSARAMAAQLGISNATLLRLMRGSQLASGATLDRLSESLRWTPDQLDRHRLENHRELVLRAVGHPQAHLNSRWLASATALPLDQVNVVLHQLLRERRLQMITATHWIGETS